jgi:hypothetical protein
MLTVHSDNIGLHHQTTNPRYVPKPVEWSEGVIPFIKVIHMPQLVASCVLCMLHFWSYRGLTRSVGASHGMRSRSKVPQVSPPHLQALQIKSKWCCPQCVGHACRSSHCLGLLSLSLGPSICYKSACVCLDCTGGTFVSPFSFSSLISFLAGSYLCLLYY